MQENSGSYSLVARRQIGDFTLVGTGRQSVKGNQLGEARTVAIDIFFVFCVSSR